jgi:hypothetical protein
MANGRVKRFNDSKGDNATFDVVRGPKVCRLPTWLRLSILPSRQPSHGEKNALTFIDDRSIFAAAPLDDRSIAGATSPPRRSYESRGV